MSLRAYQPRNILIVNTYGIGDCLFTTPFIRQLKRNFPDTSISYLANQRVASLFRNHPDLKRVFIYERDEFHAVYQTSKIKYYRKVKALLQELKKERFDCAFDFSMNGAVNFFIWQAGIPHRIGFNYKNRSKFLTFAKKIKGFEGQHVAQYYLDLLRDLDVEVQKSDLELYVKDEDQKWASDQFRLKGIKEQEKVLAVFPGGGASWGASARLKRWPAPNYRKLIEKCVEKFKGPIILMGDTTEIGLCSEIAEGLHNVHNFCGQTELGQLAALLKQCQLAVVNDGGPLHMAVAVGIKTVSIFGPVDEVVYGPFGDSTEHKTVVAPLACRPCYRAFRMSNCAHLSCLQKLDVASVLQRIEELL